MRRMLVIGTVVALAAAITGCGDDDGGDAAGTRGEFIRAVVAESDGMLDDDEAGCMYDELRAAGIDMSRAAERFGDDEEFDEDSEEGQAILAATFECIDVQKLFEIGQQQG